MSDFFTGLLGALAGGGSALQKQAESELDDARKNRLMAFQLAADDARMGMQQAFSGMEREKGQEFTSGENSKERTSRETLERERIALQEEELSQRAAHNSASLGLQRKQLELNRREVKSTFSDKSGNAWAVLGDGSIVPATSSVDVSKPFEASYMEGVEPPPSGGRTVTTKMGEQINLGHKTDLTNDRTFQTTKMLIDTKSKQLETLTALLVKADPSERDPIQRQIVQLNQDIQSLSASISGGGAPVGSTELNLGTTTPPAAGTTPPPTGTTPPPSAQTSPTKPSGLLTQGVDQGENARKSDQLKKDAQAFAQSYSESLSRINKIPSSQLFEKGSELSRLYKEAVRVNNQDAIAELGKMLIETGVLRGERTNADAIADWFRFAPNQY